MSAIDQAFPPESFSSLDQEFLATTFNNEVIQKYLRSLAKEDAKELLELPFTDPKLVEKHAFVAGKLAVLTTLLSIPR